MLDALLSGQGWIALVGLLLAGIVFFNVDLLQMNRDIAGTAQRAVEVKRENARLRVKLAHLVSSERIQQAAVARGLLLPAPGDVRYLRANPAADAERAAKHISEPGSQGSTAPPAPLPQSAPPAGAAAGTTAAPPG